MSSKRPPQPRIDKRTNRTRHALAEAMIDLGGKQGVENVTPADLARKAGVSRSTFYANFASKNDYLDRAFAAMFRSCEEAQMRERPSDSGILPSWHFFHHVHSAKSFAISIAKSETFPQYLAAREALFRERAALRLNSASPNTSRTELDGLASMLAGAFAGLMRRWMETELATPPDELHGQFEHFVSKALTLR